MVPGYGLVSAVLSRISDGDIQAQRYAGELLGTHVHVCAYMH